LFTVTENCYEGANYYGLSENEKTHLLLAALFHDVNYVLDTTLKDAQKITLAVEALYQFRKEIPVSENVDWQQAEAIIWATEFPHKEIHNLPITHQIIQDADLMQVFAPNAFVQIIVGLSQETGKTPREMIESQTSFLYNIVWNTQWARLVFEEKIKRTENEIELWKKLHA